jgi:hypothetical protein
VHVCNLTFNELTHENVRIFTDRSRGAKDLPSFCMAPPTALNRRPRDCVCQIGNRAARRLQDDAMRLNEFRRLPPVHTSRVITPNETQDQRLGKLSEFAASPG